MNKTYRIAVIGLTHDHVWSNLRELQETGKAILVAAADPHEPLLARVRKEHGCATYTSEQQMLDKEKPEAVFIYTDNAAGVELGEQAAQRNMHILIEKPMAADLTGADRLLAAVRRAGVRLMINWPFAWWPQLQQAMQMVRSGALGELWQVKYRAAHAGPRETGCSTYFQDWLFDPRRNGGGALIDYCCYGVLLARALLGPPSRVYAAAGRLCKEDILVEDNALMVLHHARGLSLAEASWTQVGKLTAYQTAIYGSRGTILVEPRQGGRLLLATAEHPEGEVVALEEPVPEWRTASANFLYGLESGKAFHLLCRDRICRDVQEILEAGTLSARRGAEVVLPLRSFSVAVPDREDEREVDRRERSGP
jgi:predicted dehydrogenase